MHIQNQTYFPILKRPNSDASRLKGRSVRQSNRSLQRPSTHFSFRIAAGSIVLEHAEWAGIDRQDLISEDFFDGSLVEGMV